VFMARKKEGKPLNESPEMKIWRKEYDEMSVEDHHAKLRELGLGDEDMEEFDEILTQEKKAKKTPEPGE